MTARRGPEVGFYCDTCDRYSVWTPPRADGTCTHCEAGNPPVAPESATPGEPLRACPQCGSRDLYRKKDMPQQAGCAVVLSAIALSTVAYALWDFPGAFAVFAAVALLDFLIYHRLGEVTVCYRCHAELRGFPENPDHGAFDMHRAEEYDVRPETD